MYWLDAVGLKSFYSSTMGSMVCRRLRRKIRRFWPDLFEKDNGSVQKINILGIGYASPYLQPLLNNDNVCAFAVMPVGQGGINWPECGENRSLISNEKHLPFEDNSIDRVVLAHSLEYTKYPLDMMGEIFRVLTPQGKVIVIVPNRMSVWVRVEATPFGHGHPYSVSQLEQLLRDSLFEATRFEIELLFPPTSSRLMLRISEWLHRLWKLPFYLRSWGGAIVMEAEKQVYSPCVDTLKAAQPRRGFIYRPISAGVGQSKTQR